MSRKHLRQRPIMTEQVKQEEVVEKVEVTEVQETVTEPVVEVTQVVVTETVVEEPVVSQAPQVIEQPIQDKSTTQPAPIVQKPISPSPVATQRSEQPVQTQTDFQKLIEKVKQTGTQGQKEVVVLMERYLSDLKVGKGIDPHEGSRIQYQFWRTLRYWIDNSEPEEFRKQWFLLLAFFNEYKNAELGPRYVYRFSEQWSHDEEQLVVFQNVLNILLLTADPKDRAQGLKKVDLDRSLAVGINERGRQRLVAFYK